MADTTKKLSVIDEAGLDAMLEAIFSKLKDAYVSQTSFEDKVAEILAKTETGGMGFVSFDIRDSDGHLICYYTGNEAPDLRIDSNDHLILTLK